MATIKKIESPDIRLPRSVAKKIFESTGVHYLRSITEILVKELDIGFDCAFVAEVVPDGKTRTRAFSAVDDLEKLPEYELRDIPCDFAGGKEMCIYRSNVQDNFPRSRLLAETHAASFAGAALADSNGKPVGLIAAIGKKPIAEDNYDKISALLQLFASGAATELERERAEEALQKSEDNYKSVFNAANDAIFVHDINTGNIMAVNAKMAEMYGYTVDEATRLNVEALSAGTPGYTQQDALHWIGQAVAGQPQLFEWRARKKNGDLFWVEVNLKRATIGGALRLLAIVRDITGRKKTEQELQRVSRQYQLILESAGDGIFGMNSSGDHILVNNAALRMLGFDADELMGKHSHPIWHHSRADGDPYPEQECKIYKTARDGISRHVNDEVFWKKDGAGVPVEYMTTPIREGDSITGTVVTFRDISERKRVEKELNRTMKELERSNEELRQFAYAASHDLKEPLRTVSGFVELLGVKYRGNLDEKADKYIAFATEGCRRMSGLIDDLLAYSRAGAIGAPLTAVDMNLVMKNAMENLRSMIRRADAVITAGLMPAVTGDETQLTQLLQNLVGNAVKFQKKGVQPKIHVSASRKGMEWLFRVTDNGIGIAPGSYERIFVVFQRLHSRDEYPGTGIGLAICKKIVERHGGKIWVESQQLGGSQFLFTLPVADQ